VVGVCCGGWLPVRRKEKVEREFCVIVGSKVSWTLVGAAVRASLGWEACAVNESSWWSGGVGLVAVCRGA